MVCSLYIFFHRKTGSLQDNLFDQPFCLVNIWGHSFFLKKVCNDICFLGEDCQGEVASNLGRHHSG